MNILKTKTALGLNHIWKGTSDKLLYFAIVVFFIYVNVLGCPVIRFCGLISKSWPFKRNLQWMRNVLQAFQAADEILTCNHSEQYFPVAVFITLYNVVLTNA